MVVMSAVGSKLGPDRVAISLEGHELRVQTLWHTFFARHSTRDSATRKPHTVRVVYRIGTVLCIRSAVVILSR